MCRTQYRSMANSYCSRMQRASPTEEIPTASENSKLIFGRAGFIELFIIMEIPHNDKFPFHLQT